MLSGNAEAFNAGLVSTNPTFANLSDVERMQFMTAVFVLFKHVLALRKGRLGKAEWEPWSNHAQMYFHQPGVQS